MLGGRVVLWGAGVSGNQPVRIATVTALEPTEPLTVCQQQFDKLRRDHPMIDPVPRHHPRQAGQTPVQELLEALFVDTETRCGAA